MVIFAGMDCTQSTCSQHSPSAAKTRKNRHQSYSLCQRAKKKTKNKNTAVDEFWVHLSRSLPRAENYYLSHALQTKAGRLLSVGGLNRGGGVGICTRALVFVWMTTHRGDATQDQKTCNCRPSARGLRAGISASSIRKNTRPPRQQQAAGQTPHRGRRVYPSCLYQTHPFSTATH